MNVATIAVTDLESTLLGYEMTGVAQGFIGPFKAIVFTHHEDMIDKLSRVEIGDTLLVETKITESGIPYIVDFKYEKRGNSGVIAMYNPYKESYSDDDLLADLLDDEEFEEDPRVSPLQHYMLERGIEWV